MILVRLPRNTMQCASPVDMRMRRSTVIFGRGPKPSYLDVPLFGGGSLDEPPQLSRRVRSYFPGSRMRMMKGKKVGDRFYAEDPDGN